MEPGYNMQEAGRDIIFYDLFQVHASIFVGFQVNASTLISQCGNMKKTLRMRHIYQAAAAVMCIWQIKLFQY